MILTNLIKQKQLTSIKYIPILIIKELLKQHLDSEHPNIFPIHYAAKYGCLEIIKYFVSLDSEVVNQMDKDGKTPLFWAAAEGQLLTVDYLLSQGAVVRKGSIAPDNSNIGNDLLTRVMQAQHYDVALKLTSSCLSRSMLLPLILTSGIAVELIMLEPGIAKLFFNDSRIASMIKGNKNIKITENCIEWYKPAGRRNSWFSRINTQTEKASVFTADQKLGEGSTGLVRQFSSEDDEEIAVKSIISETKNLSNERKKKLIKRCELDAKFTEEAYKDGSTSRIFSFDLPQSDNSKLFTIRYVMPLIKGTTAWNLIDKIFKIDELGIIVFKIVGEIIRLHKLGIIIGDMNPANIMVNLQNNTYPIRFLDLDTSHHVTDPRASDWGKLSETDRKWIPPELCKGFPSVKPNPNQNVYSLGYILKMMLDKHPLHKDSLEKLPSIHNFIINAQSHIPSGRPSLPTFYEELGKELNLKLDQNEIQVESKSLLSNNIAELPSANQENPDTNSTNKGYTASLRNTLWNTVGNNLENPSQTWLNSKNHTCVIQ